MKHFFFLLASVALPVQAAIEWEIIIPSYNNERWCIANIESVVRQTYPYWHATIVVDAATDHTAELLQAYIAEHKLGQKITLIINKKNKGALANIYTVACSTHPDKVIGLLDGDDWFKHERVLADLSRLYETEDIWMTYGQYELWPENRVGHCQPYPQQVIRTNNYRSVAGLPSHFRTFYAWLFQLIDKKDFLYKGDFLPVTWDMAIMFPLIEMAGKRHRCITQVLYVYNIDNPLNDFKKNTQLQAQLDHYIRSKPRYKTLKARPT